MSGRVGRSLGVALALLLLSAALLACCSQCSPLYPINIWGDANCLLTVGRVMRAGGVLYRDIYEQKGPTLYAVQMLGACISDTDFFGVYVMEVLSLTATLAVAARMLHRRLQWRFSLAGAALLGACLLVSASFSRGNSAEEFCLPLLMATLGIALSAYEGDQPMRPLRLVLCGVMAGLVATIKFTILGLYIGLCVCEGVMAWRAGGARRVAQSAVLFLEGMALPIALWAAYFAAHGALGDAVQAYIVNNVMRYGDEAAVAWGDTLRAVARGVRDNALWALPAVGGLALAMRRRAFAFGQRLALASMAAGLCVGVFLLGRVWPYCPLVCGVFAVLGIEPLMHAVQRLSRGFVARRVVPVGCAALALALAWAGTPNAFLRGQKLDDLAQGRLAKAVEPGATLLQYSHLDDGLYLTCGTLPQEKYFVRLNVRLDAMREALDRAVEQGVPDYVLVSWKPLPEQFDRYTLVAMDVGYDERNRLNKALYLYRRKNR